MRLNGIHKRKLMPVIQGLMNKGIRVFTEPAEANVSIVLDGKTENPLCFRGKRVLAYWKTSWGPEGHFDEIYKPILEEFYDEMIDMTDLTIGEAVERLANYEA